MFTLAAALAVATIGCGKEIGDACIVSSDCSTAGDRVCDLASPSGYCTIQGCDYATCPSEATCVRFFTGDFNNRTCDPTTEDVSTDDCSEDELCALAGHCVARSSESRFCMKTCNDNSDCRSGYECRTLELMKSHGGQPVLAPGVAIDDKAPKFCATSP